MMEEEAICAVCKEKHFGPRLAQMLTGNPNDQYILSLVQRAAREEISNEVLFGTLVEDFGREAVSNALLDVISRSESIPVTTSTPPSTPSPPSTSGSTSPSTPSSDSPSPSPSDLGSTSPSASPSGSPSPSSEEEVPEREAKETPTRTPTPTPTQTTTPAAETATETKALCSPCVARQLLGMLETFKEWFDKDKEYIISLADELENASLSPEEIIKNLFVQFGQEAKDGFDRIFMDTNVAFENAKNLAIREKPELAKIVPSPMSELKFEQQKQKNTQHI